MTREVFIAHVEREQEALRGFLLALCCGKKDDADDLAQDVLVKAYLSSAGYQDKGKFNVKTAPSRPSSIFVDNSFFVISVHVFACKDTNLGPKKYYYLFHWF